MSDFSPHHYRDLLRDLQSAIAERVHGEQALSEPEPALDDPLSQPPDAELRRLTERGEQESAEAEERHAAERQAFDARYEADVTAAEGQFRETTGEIRQRSEAELAQVEHRYEENCWMVESILDDDSEKSPKRQYETLRHQIQQSQDHLTARWDEVQALYNRAVALVEQRRQQPGEAGEPPPAPRTRKEASDRFQDAADTIQLSFDRLKRQIVPRFFIGWTFVISGLLLWGGLWAALWFLVDPAWIGLQGAKPVVPLLMGAGVSFLVCATLLGTLYGVAARQTARVMEPLQQAMAAARTHQQHWQRYANEELAIREREYHHLYGSIVEQRDRSLKQFTAARARDITRITTQRDQELEAAARRRERELRTASDQRNAALLIAEAAQRKEAVARRTQLERERKRLTAEHEERTAAWEAQRQQHWQELAGRWTEALAQLTESSARLAHSSQTQFPDWNTLAAPQWSPPEDIPTGIRIGDLELDLHRLPDGIPSDDRLQPSATNFRWPAVLPFPDSPSLVVRAEGAGRAEAASLLQVAMLRLLTLLPPGKVRFTLIDPVGLGETFAAFMHLADFDDLLISGRIWTEAAHIEQQLGNLTEHMENVFQKYLRNEFETIEEYNVHAGEVAEPYRILVVAGFPSGFSERAAQRLVSIATSGPRCGVYTLVSLDTKQSLPRDFDLPGLESHANVLRWTGREFEMRLDGQRSLPVRPDAPPPAQLFAAIVRRIGELSKDVRRVEVPFHRVAVAEDAWWTADSRRLIDCPIGRTGATKLQHMRLGIGTSQHVLVAGKTGSGKSTLLHILIVNLALRYSPDELEFYLIDFKKGVEFKSYAAHRLPHARVIAIESDREFGTSTLARLDTILKERGDQFRQAGVQDIEAFRDARPQVRMPRILLIVDEFQEFFVEDDRDSQTASLLLDRLVRQGRAFGIHVLLGSQSLGGAYSLARTTIGQMAVRVALQCSEADAHLILSEENSAARLLTRPGEAIYNDANGLLEGNSPFQIAWLGDSEKDELLDRIADLVQRRKIRSTAPVVFEGNIPADPSRNAELVERVESAMSRPAAEPQTERVPSAWLGEAVAITGPTKVTFRRQSGANLLIVGQEPNASLGMLSACLVALAAESSATEDESATFPAFTLLEAQGTTPGRGDSWRRITETIPHPVRRIGPDEAASFVAGLAAEVQRRQEESTPAPAMFVLIDDLSRFRDLRKSDDDFGFGGFDREKTVSPGSQFAEILKQGPAVGVHTLVWCDSYNNVERWFSRQLLREFEMRAVFQMSAADSSNLIDSPAASRLGNNRALLYWDERGTTEKFRPYGPPNDEWLQWLRTMLGGEQAPTEHDQDVPTIDTFLVT